MKPFRVSIVLASYNGAAYIREQLDSFVAQTRLPDELIVCDDCSQDSTVSIVQQFATEAPFQVRVVVNDKNLGYTKNFSKALSYCTGDIVFPSDQDDVWIPDKLWKVETYFKAYSDVHLLIHDIAYCKRDLTPIGQTKIERMSKVFDLQKSYVVGMASAIRGDFLRLCLPIPDGKGLTHDTWLHMCAQTLGVKVIIEDVLALHRRHGNNTTSGSLLNVDYVTTREHFRKLDLGLVRRLEQMKTDMDTRKEGSAALLGWMKQRRKELLQDGYVEMVGFDRITANLYQRFTAESLRSDILHGQGGNRLWGMVNLFRSGGYAYFRGWMSLVSDFIFRCVLRQ